MRFRVRLSTRQLGAVASSRTSNSSKTTRSDTHPESFFCRKFFYRSCWDWVSHSASRNSRECDGVVDTVLTQLHADTHFSRTRTTAHASHISCGSSVTRGQRLRFILRHVFALSSSNTSSLPDYFVLTTSTYFSTISVLHVRSTEPVSIHKRTRLLEGVWATDRLVVSTHKNNKKFSSTRKLVANTQIIITWRRSPIDATFSVGSCKTNVLTWRLLWHRRWKLPYILGRMSWRIRKSTWIRNSRMSRVCLILLQKIWYRNSLEKFWTWNAWDIHHHHGRDEYWQMIRRSSGQRQEFLSTLILFYVLVGRNKVQEQQKSGKANLKTLRCIHHIKMQWEPMETQLNSSGKNYQIFQYCAFFKRSRKTWYRRTSNRRNRIIFVSMFNDILWKTDYQNSISNGENVKDYA